MSLTNVHRLGDLQLKILKVLWQHREATVAEVHEQLPRGADLAYTTIATMLRKMETRGLVSDLLTAREVSRDELVRLEKLIAARKRRS